MGRRDKTDKKKQGKDKQADAGTMNEEEIDPNDIQPGDIEEEEDKPGFAEFVYNNVFYEWFYRVRFCDAARTGVRYR